MTPWTIRPTVRPAAADDPPPPGITFDLDGQGTIWLNLVGVALRLELTPYDAVALGGSLLKFASRFVALDDAPPAGEG